MRKKDNNIPVSNPNLRISLENEFEKEIWLLSIVS